MRHFRYRKVTPKMKQQIKTLHNKGLTQKEIAQKLNVCQSTICYRLNPENRRKAIQREKNRYRMNPKVKKREEKRRKTEKRRKYMRHYQKDRYHNDPVFRRKKIRANSGGKFKEEA